MTQENKISLYISEEDLNEIEKATEILQKKLLPHLIQVSSDEKREMPKMGAKSPAFVTKAYDHAIQNPDLAPQYLNIDEFKKDLDAVDILRQLQNPIQQLAQMLDDSVTVAGSEAYIAALAFYHSVKGAAQMNISRSKSIFEDLNLQFPGKRRSPSSEE